MVQISIAQLRERAQEMTSPNFSFPVEVDAKTMLALLQAVEMAQRVLAHVKRHGISGLAAEMPDGRTALEQSLAPAFARFDFGDAA